MASPAPEPGDAVLVFMSEPGLYRGISRTLGEAGLRVVEVDSLDQAWTTLETGPDVQVVFADLDMARGADGLELAHKIHERWPTVKMVLTSSRIRHRSPSAVPENGCFVPRPLPADILLAEIRPAASQGRSVAVC